MSNLDVSVATVLAGRLDLGEEIRSHVAYVVRYSMNVRHHCIYNSN